MRAVLDHRGHTHEHTPADDEGKQVARLEAFSDGVFAIAITLLVLDLKVPELPPSASHVDLGRALLERWPSYVAFCASFASILIMWINHHAILSQVRGVDLRLKLANGLVLLLVAVVPFTTALVARYLTHEAANLATTLYCATFLAVNVAYNLLCFSAAHGRRLLKRSVPPARMRRLGLKYLAGFPVYAVATLVSWVHPYTGMVLASSLWILWAAVGKHHHHPECEP